MKPPIIYNVSQHFAVRGSIEICNSVEVPLGYIEVVDVLNEEYIVYDSAGYLLKLEVYDVPKRRIQSIRIVEPEPPIQVADALRNILIDHLDYVIESRRTMGGGFWESILALLGISSPEEEKDREISKEIMSSILCKRPIASNRKTVFKTDRQLVQNDGPVGDRHGPFLGNITMG
jgi:hypothetical protein